MTSSYHLEDRGKCNKNACANARNVPKLRFKGYNYEWKHYRLKDITTRITRKNKKLESDRPLTISAIDGLIDQKDYFNRQIASKDMSGYYLLKNGEFAYNKSYSNGFPYGSIKRLNKYDKGALSTLYICFSLQNICSDFLEKYFETDKWYKEIYMIAVEGARNHGLLNISVEDFFNTMHKFPNIEEQEKIASFLTLIDKKIEKQKELVELLKKYKKGLLSAIFSQKLRFKDDNGNDYPAWEEKYIQEVCSITTGKGNTQDKEENGIYPFYVRSPIVEKSNKYIFDGEAVLTVGDGVGTGKVFHYVNGKFNFHQRVYKMSNFSGINGRYFYYYFSTHFYDRVKRMTAKTSVDSVRMDMIAKMPIFIPTNEEQDKIINLLTNVENIFLKNEESLFLLQEYKKGLLQQLFI